MKQEVVDQLQTELENLKKQHRDIIDKVPVAMVFLLCTDSENH